MAQFNWPRYRPDIPWAWSLPPLYGGGIQPFAQSDFPNPRGQAFSNDLRTWDYTSLALTAPPGPPYFAKLDWPNPRGSDYPVTLRSFLFYYIQDTNPQPFSQPDYPLPLQPRFPVDLRTWLVRPTIGTPPLPFFQTDYPNPRGGAFPGDLRTWLAAKALEVPPLPFVQTDYPNPRGAAFPSDLRSWILAPFQGSGPVPFAQFDWPLIKAAGFANDLRQWVSLPTIAPAIMPAGGQSIPDRILPSLLPPGLLHWVQTRANFFGLGFRITVRNFQGQTSTQTVTSAPGLYVIGPPQFTIAIPTSASTIVYAGNHQGLYIREQEPSISADGNIWFRWEEDQPVIGVSPTNYKPGVF